jgi:competence protein ComEC
MRVLHDYMSLPKPYGGELYRGCSNSEKPLLLKVSHHGSNDQSARFHQQLNPDLALISVGSENGYGHPGKQALEILGSVGSQVLRTDLLGAIAVSSFGGELRWSATGR